MERLVWCGFERLMVHGILGDYEWERHQPRDYEIDLSVAYDAAGAIAGDDLSLAVDYAAMAELVRNIAKREAFRLLESCAAAIVDAVFGQFDRVQDIEILVRKPGSVEGATASFCRLRQRRNG